MTVTGHSNAALIQPGSGGCKKLASGHGDERKLWLKKTLRWKLFFRFKWIRLDNAGNKILNSYEISHFLDNHLTL